MRLRHDSSVLDSSRTHRQDPQRGRQGGSVDWMDGYFRFSRGHAEGGPAECRTATSDHPLAGLFNEALAHSAVHIHSQRATFCSRRSWYGFPLALMLFACLPSRYDWASATHRALASLQNPFPYPSTCFQFASKNANSYSLRVIFDHWPSYTSPQPTGANSEAKPTIVLKYGIRVLLGPGTSRVFSLDEQTCVLKR